MRLNMNDKYKIKNESKKYCKIRKRGMRCSSKVFQRAPQESDGDSSGQSESFAVFLWVDHAL